MHLSNTKEIQLN